MRFQIYWPKWWRIIPFLSTYPADEFGPKERWLCWSIFQFSWYVWENKS